MKKVLAVILAVILLSSVLAPALSVFAQTMAEQYADTPVLALDTDTQVSYNGDVISGVLRFIPETSGVYCVSSSGQRDTYITVYDEYSNEKGSNDDGGLNNNFELYLSLEAGETYYLFSRLYHSADSGKYNVKIVKDVEKEIGRVEIEPINLIENTVGYTDTDEAGDTYWRYELWNVYPEYTVYYTDGTCSEKTSGSTRIGAYYYNPYWNSNKDTQYTQHWYAGNTYTVSYTFKGVECETSVTVLQNPVDHVVIEPVSIVENTKGGWEQDSQEEKYWHYYSWNISPKYTVFYKDGTQSETRTGSTEINGNYYYIDWSTNQYEDHWYVNNTYTIPCTFAGVSCSFDVSIIENPVGRIEIEGYSIMENTNGDTEIDSEGNQYWHYYTWTPFYTVYLKDGTSITSEYGNSVEIAGDWYSLNYSADQYNNHWYVNNTYTVPCTFMGVSCSFDVTITENPVDYVEIENVTVVENQNGYYEYDGDDNEFFYYWYPTPEYTVHFKDKTSVTVKGYRSVRIGDSYYHLFIYGANQYEEHWTVGNTYTIECSFMGMPYSFDVTVERNHVVGIEILNVEKIKKSDSYRGGHYDIPDFSYKIITDNGTDSFGIYTSYEYNDSVRVTSDQNVHPWTPGGNNEFTVTIYGITTTANVEIENDCDFDYFEQDDGIIITDCNLIDENIVIPEEIDGKPVVGAKCMFYSGVKTVTIPASVKYLTYTGFESCGKLQNIFVDPENPNYSDIDGVLTSKDETKILAYPLGKGNIYNVPATVTDMYDLSAYAYRNVKFITADNAFVTIDGVTYTSDMKKVVKADSELSGDYVMPESVEEMAEGAFSDCSKLTSVKVSSKVRDIVYASFVGCSSLKSIDLPKGLKSISRYTFNGCFELEDVYYNSSGSDWCKIDFENYSSNPLYFATNLYTNGQLLTDLTVDGSVDEIKDFVFAGYSHLKTLTISNGVKTIGYDAFADCGNLTKAVIANSVKTMRGGTFAGCSSLTDLTISTALKEICEDAFSGTALTAVTIPDGVTAIRDGAFANCRELVSVTVPNSVTVIGNNAFGSCRKLENIPLNSNIVKLGSGAFSDTAVTSVTIPNSVTEMGDYVFSWCDKLKSVTFSNTMTVIPCGMFAGCESLESIVIPTYITDIESDAFYGCENLKTVEFANNNVRIGEYAFGGCDLSNTRIPSGTVIINAGAFKGTDMKEAKIPSSVTDIVYYAFAGSEVETIDMPASVKKISSTAFMNTPWYDAQDIGAVYINHILYGYKGDIPEDTVLEVKSGTTVIADGALGYSDMCDVSGLTKVVLPDGLEVIGDYAFFNCYELTEINIPASVEKIGKYALAGCTSLASIKVDPANRYFTFENGMLFNKNKTELILCLPGEYQTYDIPASVTKIDAFAFSDCFGATVKINRNDVEIERYAIGYSLYGSQYDNWYEFIGYKIACEEGSTAAQYRDTYLLKAGIPHTADHTGTEIRNARAATCTEVGYTGDVCCAVCGEKLESGEIIPALGHTASDWIVDEEATADSVGHQHKECTVCGSVLEEEEIPELITHIPGDINGDGAVNNKDLTRLFRYLSDWDVEVVLEALDVNGDGSVNNKDLTRLFRYLSDWDVEIF